LQPKEIALQQGFFFVDKGFEISNQSIIKDMVDLIIVSEGFF
jgi:hypothetical protein